VSAFFAGSLTSSVFEWLHEITTVEVTNTSDKTIKHLDITYRAVGDHRGRIADGISPGESVTFKWATVGEASYRLHAIFADGTAVTGGLGYT